MWVSLNRWRGGGGKPCHINTLSSQIINSNNFVSFLQQLVAIVVGWTACWVLTETNQLPTDPGTVGYRARTDGKTQFIANSSWIYIPYPGVYSGVTLGNGIC